MAQRSRLTGALSRNHRDRIKAFLPNRAILAIARSSTMITTLRSLRGRHKRECPICHYQGYFMAAGSQPLVFDAVCPGCRSIGRHRQHYLLLSRHAEWIEGKDVLHIAPEPCFVAEYRQRVRQYIQADYLPSGDEIKVDIQALQFGDASLDLIICHHVIEHVPDDRAALAEFYRVLRPGGIVLLSAPTIDAWETTYENSAITDPWERDRHFNQDDHFRLYGRDLSDRIRGAGFRLDRDIAREPEAHRYSLERGETIFIGHK